MPALPGDQMASSSADDADGRRLGGGTMDESFVLEALGAEVEQ